MTITTWLASVALAAPDCAALEHLMPGGLTCEAAATSSASAFEQARGERFGVRIELLVSRSGGAFQPVPVGSPVCNGDHVAFRVTPSQRGYLHILTHGTEGSWDVLFPPRGRIAAAFTPRSPVRRPEAPDKGYPLSGAPGTEYVLFFVSPEPFSQEVSRELDSLLRRSSPSEQPVAIDGGGDRAMLLLQASDGAAAHVVGRGEQRIVLPLNHARTCR